MLFTISARSEAMDIRWFASAEKCRARRRQSLAEMDRDTERTNSHVPEMQLQQGRKEEKSPAFLMFKMP